MPPPHPPRLPLLSLLLIGVTCTAAVEWGDAKAARAGAESPTVQATGGGETLDQSLVAATFAAGNWHTAEGRMGCVRGVRRTVVGHVSVNAGRQPRGPHDTLYIGDEVESVRVWYDPRGGAATYRELLAVFWEVVGDPTHVLSGPLGPQQWQSALLWHTEEQQQLALASLAVVRKRHRPKYIDNGATEDEHELYARNTTVRDDDGDKGDDRDDDDDIDGGAGNPVKTLAMRVGSFFEPAPLAAQKAELRRRDELRAPFAPLLRRASWVMESQASATLNAYLSGGCMSRLWAETAAELTALHLSFAQLEALGLEHLYPGVIVLPAFGAKEEREAGNNGKAQGSKTRQATGKKSARSARSSRSKKQRRLEEEGAGGKSGDMGLDEAPGGSHDEL